MYFGDNRRYDRDHGEGFISARGAREIEEERNWYKELNEHTIATLDKHMKNPFDAKFIWSSFLSLDPHQQSYADDNIKHNANSFKMYYPHLVALPEHLRPTTYAQWRRKYPYAKFCPPGWSFFRQKNLGDIETSDSDRSRSRSRTRSRDRGGSKNTQSEVGGSRRSLQKSRLVKRKSRKYKSIKKSKKRSFRKRSGKY